MITKEVIEELKEFKHEVKRILGWIIFWLVIIAIKC